MATFPYNDATFFLDSLLQEGGLTPSFSAYPHPQPPQGIDCHCALQITNETPITDKSKTDSSSMVLELDSDGPIETSIETKRKNRGSSCLSSAQSQDNRRTGTKKQRKSSTRKEEQGEGEGEFLNKDQKEPPTGYIHVRARRGQATDSHSLAERVRREKISERMKLLQGLVPGSDKVTGKAHMLDEIINYVQSLQYQVEFLSMKLASANPVPHDFGRDVNAVMVRPESMSSMIASSPLPSNLSQPTAFADMIATSTAKHKYSHQNNLLPLPPQQAHMLSAFSQDNGNLPWDVLYDRRQRFLNQCSFNNLC